MKYLNQQANFPLTAKRLVSIFFVSLGLVACGDDDATNTSSATIAPVILNDTGLASLTGCADQINEGLACVDTAATHPRQDADLGRDADAALNDNSDGALGFSFTKMDAAGVQLAASAPSWDCVLDNVTGLVWEVKTAVPGLRANTNTYTWFDSNRAYASGDRGVENGGICSGIASCDTEAYVAAINRAALCGLTDWRLPSRAELQSIVDYSQDEPGPMLDSNYFPNVHNTNSVHGLHRDWYWSSQTTADYAKYAWAIGFNTGGDSQISKQSTQLIRLVRGGS